MSRALLSLVLLLTALAPASVPAQGIQRITAAGQKDMLANPGTESAGAPNADVTIVEYFDYNCPYCKQLPPEFRSLLAADHKVAIVYKEWPIFGGVSVYAATAALAAGWQGKYLLAHDTLMNGPHWSDDDQVDAALQAAGIDTSRLAQDRVSHAAEIEALLRRSGTEARALNLRGTPGLVVGRQILPGTVDLRELKRLVANARRQDG